MRRPLIFSLLVVFALGLAACAGPSQTQYNEALKDLGAAQLENRNLRERIDSMEDTTAELQRELLRSESLLSAAVISSERMEEEFTTLQVAGFCSQSWELIANPEFVIVDITDGFLSPAAIADGYEVYATQYLTMEDPKILEDIRIYLFLVNVEIFPGVLFDLTQGCIVVAPQSR